MQQGFQQTTRESNQIKVSAITSPGRNLHWPCACRMISWCRTYRLRHRSRSKQVLSTTRTTRLTRMCLCRTWIRQCTGNACMASLIVQIASSWRHIMMLLQRADQRHGRARGLQVSHCQVSIAPFTVISRIRVNCRSYFSAAQKSYCRYDDALGPSSSVSAQTFQSFPKSPEVCNFTVSISSAT